MALLAGTDSTELLDFLFDQTNGILTHDSYMTNDYTDHTTTNYTDNMASDDLFTDSLKTADFNFSDCEADELLNCLTEVDLLTGIIPTDCDDQGTSLFTNSVVSHCHEDHIYSRCPDDNTCNNTCCNASSPSTESAVSKYSYNETGSPDGIALSDDCYSSSSVSSGNGGQYSPLGGNMEDLNLGINGMYNQTIFVIHGNQLVDAVNSTQVENIVDDSELCSLDIIETDVESCSDDNSTGAHIDNVNDCSMFDDVSFSTGSDLPFTLNDLDARSRKKSHLHHKLTLSDEEKLLLAREGISIPTDVPLTKEEERALKSVRRKIRNKVSAKVSRKRKQDYVDGLEKRVKICSMQNRQLQQKVEKLEKLNQSFLTQLKKLQALISVPNGVNVRHAQTGTCIMVLVMSFAFFILPNVGPWLGSGQPPMSYPNKAVGPGRSRSLLTENAMLFSEPLDYSDVDINSDSSNVDPLPPDVSSASLNPYQMSPEEAEDLHDKALMPDKQKHQTSNVSFVIVDPVAESAGLPQTRDTAFKTAEDGEVADTTVIDMSKFPAKNDL